MRYLLVFLIFVAGCQLDKKEVPVYNFETLSQEIAGTESRVLVVNFWATWCGPCVKELPAFEQLQERYKNRGVEVLLVSLDFPDELETKLYPFIKKHQVASKVVLLDAPDQNVWIPKISPKWSGAIPATLIVKEGKQAFYEQSFDFSSLEKEVQSFLK